MIPLPPSPYIGLVPYSEKDAQFFVGRERECDLVLANLRASNLTILYGASGVGKSSLLHAGVVHRLGQQSTGDGRPGRSRGVVLVESWHGDPVRALRRALVAPALEAGRPLFRPAPAEVPLAKRLEARAERSGGKLVVILDQFEEYFLYHGDGGPGPLGEALAPVINNRASRVSFLLSLREDALASVDRFKGLIPRLFDNYLRIDHLDTEAAQRAILEPVARHNELFGDDGGTTVDPELVPALLYELGAAVGTERIEAPYLQLVLTRLWERAQTQRPRVMDVATLRALGGARPIVAGHVESGLDALPPTEQDAAARMFDRLVTPSGSKIAHTVEDLAEYAGRPELVVRGVLETLSRGETRILRRVEPALDRPGMPRYEILHDVLAQPILDWCAAHVRAVPSAAPGDEPLPSKGAAVSRWSGEADGVLSAGGVHVFGLLGAMRGLAEHPVRPIERWSNVAGSGWGSLVAALLAAGRDLDEVESLLRQTDFSRLADRGLAGTIGTVLAVAIRGAVYRGRALTAWLDTSLQGATFADVRAGPSYRLRLLAADVTHAELLILPDDLPRYRVPGAGAAIDPDRFPIAKALRMCMTIPYLFPGVELERVDTGRTATIVEGSLLGELPVWLFDSDRPVRPTFALQVRRAQRAGAAAYPHGLPRPLKLSLDLLRTTASAYDSRFTSKSSRARTVLVDDGLVPQADFAISEAEEGARRCGRARRARVPRQVRPRAVRERLPPRGRGRAAARRGLVTARALRRRSAVRILGRRCCSSWIRRP